MIILHFEEQDKKIEVNYALLKAIADNMPQNEQYSNLVGAIFELGIPSLSTSLANNRLLSLNQRAMITNCLWPCIVLNRSDECELVSI